MISFKDFLLEAHTDAEAEALANKIKKDCSYFLGLRKEPLWRGINETRSTSIKSLDIEGIEAFYGTVRQDRCPKDSPQWFHDVLNDYFFHAFGIKFRSESLFCLPSYNGTSSFGRAKAIYPIGNFDYIWSPIIQDPTEDFKPAARVIKPLPAWPNSEEDLNEIVLSLADEFGFSDELKSDIEKDGAVEAFKKHSENYDVVFSEKELNRFRQNVIALALDRRGKTLYKFNSDIKNIPDLHEIMVHCKNYYAINANSVERLKKYL